MLNGHEERLFPILETERLILREITVDDASILHQYWSDAEVTEYLTQSFASIEETLTMITLLRGLYENQQGIRWAITAKSDGRVLGTCGFHNYHAEHFRAEMGYELGKEYWGQKIMTEALKAILHYGFKYSNYNRIEAFVNYGNARSTGILEKVGFMQDGLLRDYEFARGKFVDQYCYSLLKADYQTILL